MDQIVKGSLEMFDIGFVNKVIPSLKILFLYVLILLANAMFTLLLMFYYLFLKVIKSLLIFHFTPVG